ncbi:porin [Flavitalea antarctica]
MRTITSILFVCISLNSPGQDSIKPKSNPLTISGYVEAYYGYDFGNPESNKRPSFLYNYNRHNEFNLNLGFIKAAYNENRVRANFAIAAGTYVNANYSAEPGVLKNVFEANAGYKLSDRKNIWFDIGILPSHIGFESAVGKDNWALTRSLVAENSPYFESGARISYTSDNGKWFVSALALNGWQRIAKLEGNTMISWGSQVAVKPANNLTLNYSTFFGTDKPDSARLFRTYHNIYGTLQVTTIFGFTAGFDIGTEEKPVAGNSVNIWYTPVFITRLTPFRKWALSIRGEYFRDKYGVIIPTGTPNGFETIGLSANIDFIPVPNAMLRLEFRHLHNGDKIFIDKDGNPQSSNAAITLSTAVSF